MFNYGYLTYQAGRAKAPAEQRETDAQMGRLSAAFAQLLRPLTKSARALRRRPGTGLRPCVPADNGDCLPGHFRAGIIDGVGGYGRHQRGLSLSGHPDKM